MAVNSVGTYGAMQSFLQNITLTQNSLYNSQTQISNGFVSNTFDGLGGNVEQFVSLTAQVNRMQNYHSGNSILTSSLQTATTGINQMISIANSFKSLLATQLSGTANGSAFAQQVDSSLASMTSQMNTTYQGRYVFGGTNTNTPPVTSPLPGPVELGVPDAGYYQGAKQNTTFRIADGQSVENGIRADNPAFQQIIAAFHLADGTAPSTENLKKAQNLLDSGLQLLIGLQSSANADLVRVQQVDSQSETVRVYYQGLSESMAKSDVVALSTKVAQDQTTLQASYSVFARISSLTLANYLK